MLLKTWPKRLKRMPHLRNNGWFIGILALALAACAGNPQGRDGRPSMAQPPIPQLNNLKHTLAITDPLGQTPADAMAMLVVHPNLTLSTNPANAQFHLQLQPRTPEPLGEASPRWQGQLSKVQQQYRYPLSYTFTNQAREVLEQGVVEAIGTPQQVIWPSPAAQPQPTAEVTQQWLSLVLAKTAPIMDATPWQATVVAVVNPEHVAIDAGPANGLVLRAQLMTATDPMALLEVVNFTPQSDGSFRTTLRILEGLQPQPGRTVIKADY